VHRNLPCRWLFWRGLYPGVGGETRRQGQVAR
jgi:hypothetical protein